MLAFSHYALICLLAYSACAEEFLVKVGANGLKFEPNQINANGGDSIIFEFHPKNHTLTQSNLVNPCSAIPNGGNTGFMPVAATATAFPTKRLSVPDSTTPLWFFCAQASHCKQGMVFAVNPGSPEKMQTFLTNAANSDGGAAPSPPGAGTIPAPGPPTSAPAPSASTDAGAPSPTGNETGAGGNNAGTRLSAGLSSLILAGIAAELVL